MAEENQTGLIGILGGIGKAAGKLLGRRGEQAKRDVPSFDSGGLQIAIGTDASGRPIIMDTRGSKSGIESLGKEVKTTRIEKLDIPLIPGISEDRNILNALMNDMDDKVDEETKQFYYRTIIPRLFQEAQTDAEKRQLKMLADELGVDAFASGGRAGYQEGGVSESRTLPPEFIEAAQKTYLTDLSRQAGIPSITTAIAAQPGETAEQFAQRQAQAQQFNIARAGMAELAPQVAAQDPLQAAAYQQAVDPTTGLGSFQPFLTKAGTAADAATGLTGAGAGTGAGTIAEYTSPFQQQVIDTTLSEFDKQRQIQQNRMAAQALGVTGAFGGGREGVQRAEFDAASDLNRARLVADLQQRGFQNAAQRRQQDLQNQLGIANLQSGLGARAQDFSRAQISGLGTLGAGQQAQAQAILDAQRQAAQLAVQDPRDRLATFGQGIAQITPGAGAIQLSPTAATAPGPSPLAQALGLGLAGADIYGRLFPRTG